MSYLRVMPRDLFNEAGLLKCLGRIWINVENAAGNNPARHIAMEHDGSAFVINQNDADGSISISNVMIHIYGEALNLSRPLNSREAWPLWVEDVNSSGDFDPIEVFAEDGAFSPDK